MAPLPAGRLAYRERPFTHCGVDYFGPMQVKIGRRLEKRWGVIFTCMTTRAVHLELAHSLTASSAIMALQRLAARRGRPAVLYSDNGTNFRGACSELRGMVKAIDTERQREYALQNGMRWKFNPPDAPHMGGAWERLVRTVKTALRAVLREQTPAEEVLLTLLAEVESTVNSRPLTHVSVDPRDEEALTPNHFLIGTSSTGVKWDAHEMRDVCPRKRWRIAQALADAFWRRWLREYMPTLLPRGKWTERVPPMRVGDVVLIMCEQAPRNTWRRGVVTATFPGIDGEVRVVRVRTPQGEVTRPVHRLITLLRSDIVQG